MSKPVEVICQIELDQLFACLNTVSFGDRQACIACSSGSSEPSTSCEQHRERTCGMVQCCGGVCETEIVAVEQCNLDNYGFASCRLDCGSSGLSTGAIVGIIFAVLFVIVTIGLYIWHTLRQRRTRDATAETTKDEPGSAATSSAGIEVEQPKEDDHRAAATNEPKDERGYPTEDDDDEAWDDVINEEYQGPKAKQAPSQASVDKTVQAPHSVVATGRDYNDDDIAYDA